MPSGKDELYFKLIVFVKTKKAVGKCDGFSNIATQIKCFKKFYGNKKCNQQRFD